MAAPRSPPHSAPRRPSPTPTRLSAAQPPPHCRHRAAAVAPRPHHRRTAAAPPPYRRRTAAAPPPHRRRTAAALLSPPSRDRCRIATAPTPVPFNDSLFPAQLGIHQRNVFLVTCAAACCGGMAGATTPFVLSPLSEELRFDKYELATYASSLSTGMWIGSFVGGESLTRMNPFPHTALYPYDSPHVQKKNMSDRLGPFVGGECMSAHASPPNGTLPFKTHMRRKQISHPSPPFVPIVSHPNCVTSDASSRLDSQLDSSPPSEHHDDSALIHADCGEPLASSNEDARRVMLI